MQKVFWLIGFMTIHILPADVVKPTYGILNLPTEVLDSVAQYLIFKDREFDDEFHRRTSVYASKKRLINKMKGRKERHAGVHYKVLSPDGTVCIESKEYMESPVISIELCVISLRAEKNIVNKFRLHRCNNNLLRFYFNKQETKIIVYQDRTRTSFTIAVTTDQEHENKSKKTFADYCKQHCICKGM